LMLPSPRGYQTLWACLPSSLSQVLRSTVQQDWHTYRLAVVVDGKYIWLQPTDFIILTNISKAAGLHGHHHSGLQ
jgi:hypothetical protein